MESATTFQISYCISRESIIFSSYGRIWEHFHLSFNVQMCIAASWSWILCSGAYKDSTTLIVSSYEEISSILWIREREIQHLGWDMEVFSFLLFIEDSILSYLLLLINHTKKSEIWFLLLLAFGSNVKMLLLPYLWNRQPVLNVLKIVILVGPNLFHT